MVPDRIESGSFVATALRERGIKMEKKHSEAPITSRAREDEEQEQKERKGFESKGQLKSFSSSNSSSYPMSPHDWFEVLVKILGSMRIKLQNFSNSSPIFFWLNVFQYRLLDFIW